MNLTIKATDTTLTSAMETGVREKFSAIEKFLKPEYVVRVEIGLSTKHHQSGQIFRAEVHISPSNFYAESTGEDLYEAIDLLVPKVREQLTQAKDKRLSLRRRFGGIKWKFWEN